MLRSMNLTRTAVSRTGQAKPLCSLRHNLNQSFSKALGFKCLRINKHSPTLNTFNGATCCSRFVHHDPTPEVVEEKKSRRQPFKAYNNELDAIIYNLDMDARRLGRLTREDVENLLLKIKELEKVTSAQGLLIIRCCGALMPEEFRHVRVQLANRIWDTLRELNCPLDVSHYNVLLKVYLENEQQFSPIEFLSNMESSGIIANRVTYQRMIARFCAEGDIDGASKILEFMKEKEIAVNEMVFNELIFGHAKINDMAGAKNIIEVMTNAQLEPSSRTYFTLARGYALHGNLEGVIHTIEEAERNQTSLTDKDYLNIIYTMAVNGHEDKIDDILKRPSIGVSYNQECINIILELINAGKDQLAFKIFQTMPTMLGRDGNVASSGLFLIRQMVRAERPTELVLEVCKKLGVSNNFNDGLTRATFYALAYKKPAHALLFIKEMGAEGLPIRNHYFWPVFVEKAKEGEQAIYGVLREMGDLGCPPSNETLVEFVLPHIDTLNPELIIEKFRAMNHSVDFIISQLTAFYLTQQQPAKAAELLDKHPVSLVPSIIAKALALAIKGTENIEPILKILSHLVKNLDVAASQMSKDWCGQFLIHYATENTFNSSTFISVLEAMLQKDLRISHAAAKDIQMIKKMSTDIISALGKLAFSDIKGLPNETDSISLTSSSNANEREMAVEELENHLLELRRKDLNTRGILKRLLLLHCKNLNVNRVLEIKEELDQKDFVYTSGMYAQLIDLFVSTENLPEALKLLGFLKADKEFRFDTYKVLNLCTLMVKEGMADEALQLLSQQKELNRVLDDKFIERSVFKLLAAAAHKGDVDLTHKLFELTVVRLGYAKPSNYLLGSKIQACLIKNDLTQALKEFENAALNYKCTPLKNEIIQRLISTEDSENLQKVIDITTEIHGEANTLYELAVCLLSCDRVKQAKKILETPGLRANNNRLNTICENLIEKGKVKELEHLVSISKDLFDIDRDMMFYNLIRAFVKENLVEKALGVWTTMQEEDVQPSVRTLEFLANVSKKKNHHPITIQISQGAESTKESKTEDAKVPKVNKPDGKQTSTSIDLLLRARKLKEALQMTEDSLQKKIKLSENVLYSLLKMLAEDGNVEDLKRIEPQLVGVKIHDAKSYLCEAYIKNGKPLTALENLENNANLMKDNFPIDGLYYLLQSCPEDEDRIVKMAERYHKDFECCHPKNSLWQHYMIKGDYTKADHILKTCPEVKHSLVFRRVLNHLKTQKSLELAEKLLSVVNNTQLSLGAKGIVNSQLLGMLVDNNQVDEALRRLEEMQKLIPLSKLDKRVLIKLERELQKQGRTSPFQVANIKKVNEVSSDSSDDERTSVVVK